MTRPDTLPDLTHRWQATSGPSYQSAYWECPACLIASRAAFDALCPACVLAYAREQYAAGYRDALAGYPLSRDPSQPESQPAPVRRPSRRIGSPAGGAPFPPDTDTDKEG